MEIFDTIQASTIEDEDQVIIDGDPVEVWTAVEADNDPYLIVITGLSNNTGDRVVYTLAHDALVDIWGV